MSVQKSWPELLTMHRACAIVVEALDALEAAAVPGATTRDLDRIAREVIEGHGARPAFLGYRNYPATLCASVNEQVVHGIPGKRKLLEGDIVGLDLGCIVDGFYGDAARTVGVGQIGPEAERLLRVTRSSFSASALTLPTRTVRAASPKKPSTMQPRSRPTMSPSSSLRLPGIPCTTCSFTEAHRVAG